MKNTLIIFLVLILAACSSNSARIENEIVSRYYYQTGRAENSLKEDLVIKKSIEVLKDIDNFNHILGN